MFKALYKTSLDVKGTQAERRNALLKKQKLERQCAQDLVRNVEEIFSKNKSQKSDQYQKRQQQRLERTFREIYGVELGLQQSEWLRERPEDLCDWLLVPCPKGQRSLVVAHNHQTSVYNKLGRRVCIFRSMLPGDGIESDSLTILDCIYVRESNVFYVLDVLALSGSHNLLYCEAEFRFFWLRSKWDEFEHLGKRSASNQKPFHLLKQFDFEDTPRIAEALQKFPFWSNNKPELDGLLFYHRYASYTCGVTPLVGWLFPFMVPDILDLQVNKQYAKPIDYDNPAAYMDLFDERLKSKLERNQKRDRKESVDTLHLEESEGAAMEDEDNDEDPVQKVLEAERALEMEKD